MRSDDFRFSILKRAGAFALGRRGFTLLEVLVALGIFAMGVLGLMLALQATVQGATSVQRENEIRAQLESRLARLSVGPLQEFAEGTEFEGTSYGEEVLREEVTNSEATVLNGFWRVRVVARWQQEGAEQEWVASHLVYQP